MNRLRKQFYSLFLPLALSALLLTSCQTKNQTNEPTPTVTDELTPASESAPDNSTSQSAVSTSKNGDITLQRLSDAPLFLMTYHSSYSLDKFSVSSALPIQNPSIMCSTFYAANENGEHITGRNFDFDPSPAMVVKNFPQNGYASISVVDLAFLDLTSEDDFTRMQHSPELLAAAPWYPMDGINEKGVTMTVMETLHNKKDMGAPDKQLIDPAQAIRIVLDRAATADEAVELMKNYCIQNLFGVQYHFLIGDADGHSVILEYIDDEMVVLDNPDSYQISTNFVIQSYLKNGFTKYPCSRYRKMLDTLKQASGILSDLQAKQLLRDVRQSHTQWSCLYNNTTCSLDVSVSTMEDDYYTISLEEPSVKQPIE